MSKKLTIANDPLAFLGQDEVVTLLIDEIEVEEQVRKEFGIAEIQELADSIKQVGIITVFAAARALLDKELSEGGQSITATS